MGLDLDKQITMRRLYENVETIAYTVSLWFIHSNAEWFIALSSGPSIAQPAGYSTQKVPWQLYLISRLSQGAGSYLTNMHFTLFHLLGTKSVSAMNEAVPFKKYLCILWGFFLFDWFFYFTFCSRNRPFSSPFYTWSHQNQPQKWHNLSHRRGQKTSVPAVVSPGLCLTLRYARTVAVHALLFLLGRQTGKDRASGLDTHQFARYNWHPLICEVQLFTDDLRRSSRDPSPAKTRLKRRTFAVKGHPRSPHLFLDGLQNAALEGRVEGRTTHITSLYKLILRDDESLPASLENILSWHR